ncbi:MAG TPA: MerR family transcriptional regulator [Chloroflexota bacterium]|nr:MerR family transcriptional regulator [Chloroflexota bacterium]
MKIGDFSKLTQLSVKALRYYDEIGLLKPTEVDRFTGYRYYSVQQLPRLNRLLALKDLGLSLDQIANMLDGDLPAAQIRGMLRLKQAEIQQRVDEERGRLARVEARLREIEREGTMSNYDVVTKKIEPQLVASLRRVVPSYGQVGPLFGELYATAGRRGLKPTDAPIAVYYDPEYREKDVDVEACAPIDPSSAQQAPDIVRELPGIDTAACILHQGSYETLVNSYTALHQWLEANGYQICGPNREIYLHTPEMEGGNSAMMTEIQFPIEKR